MALFLKIIPIVLNWVVGGTVAKVPLTMIVSGYYVTYLSLNVTPAYRADLQ